MFCYFSLARKSESNSFWEMLAPRKQNISMSCDYFLLFAEGQKLTEAKVAFT